MNGFIVWNLRDKLNWRKGKWDNGTSDNGCKLNIEACKNYKEDGLVSDGKVIGKK